MSTILLVDDEEKVLSGLKRILRKEPYTVLTCTNAEDALRTLAQTNVDVVVSDENMPGISGSEFISRVRRQYPSTVRIILTGQQDISSAMRAIYEGQVYQYLFKPVHPLDLISTIYNGLLVRSLSTKYGELAPGMPLDEAEKLLAQFTTQNDSSQPSEAVDSSAQALTADETGEEPVHSNWHADLAVRGLRKALDRVEQKDMTFASFVEELRFIVEDFEKQYR